MGNLFLRDLIVYTVLVIFVLFVTKQNNMWGTRKGTKKTKVEVQKDKETAFKRNIILTILSKCDFVAKNFGFQPSPTKVEQYRFMITRGRMMVPFADRAYTPTEIIGFFKIIKFLCCFGAFFFSILLGNRLFLMLLCGMGVNKIFEYTMEFKIQEEDNEIEEDFPDLYMLLYSRLMRGTKSRLAPTLDDYIRSIDAVYGEESHKAMRNFVLDLRRNIEIYGDDSMAVHKMRDIYRSAMLVNFFNLAIQSLRGVDNRDKLLAFKMELSQQKLDAMTAAANALVAKGQKAVMLIFLILAQFVILSWVAKAGLAFVRL